jgi:muramidase (phage lysozyme)
MTQRKQETDEADKARAVTDFHRNNQESFAEAVRTGKIPPTASKSYVEWYKKQQGHLAGLKLSDKFAIDYQHWEGRNSDDPEAFGKFVSGWMTKNVGEEQDPYVLEGLAPHLDRLSTSGYDTFNQDRAASLRAKSQTTSGAILTDTISRTQEAGRAEGTLDYDALWSSLMTQRDEAISKGERGEDFDKLIVDSIILQAEESGSKEILKILDKKLPGQDLPLSSNPDFREKRLRSIDRINSKQASQATDIAQTRERLEKQHHEELLSRAVLALHNGQDVPEQTITELSRRDGEIRHKLAKYKKEYQDQETDEDPQALMEVYREIDSGADKKFVLDMREKGVIKDPATFLKAMDRADAVQKAVGDGGVFSSPTYKDTVRFITDQTGTDQLSFDGSKGLSDEGLEALFDYRNKLLDWDMKHPDSSLLEKEKAAKEIGEFVRSRIQPATSADATTKNEYLSEADEAKRAAEPQESPQVDAPPPAEPEEGSYLPQTIRNIWDYFTGDDEEQPEEAARTNTTGTAPPIETLSQSTRQSLETFAKRKGLSVNEAYGILSGRVYKLMPEEADPGVDHETTNSISPETRDKLTSLLQDPPKVQRLTASNVPVAPLLGLIGNTEGTDKGDGYNETLGYGKFTGGDVNLVGMTLGDIDKLQTEMLRHPDNSLNSSALGRYQIIRTTLRGLKEEMGLTDNMLFDEGLQDRMAMHLLERRGLSKWQAGQMSDEQFMDNLSAEWASLPKANGKGTYRGQRTGTTPGGVMTAFDQIRGKEVASLDPTIGMGSDPYANIPETDSRGEGGQREKFRQWKSFKDKPHFGIKHKK